MFLSATAGQVLDRTPKSRAIRWIKWAEVGVMALGFYGFFTQNIWVLLTTLLLTGVQSTFFGPAKYSLLPEVLADKELVGGNGLMETGTFLAILTGTIVGGSIMAAFGLERGPVVLSVTILVVALCGVGIARLIPHTEAIQPDLEVDWNPITPNVEIFRVTRRDHTVFLGVMGLSWFWFLGTAMLAVVPAYADRLFEGNAHGITYFTALFSIGIGVGSLLCERLSSNRLELGLVPLGSIGMTVFLVDLFFVGMPTFGTPGVEVSIGEFLWTWSGLRISFDLMMTAVFGGIFTVPLYTLIQSDTPAERRSRVIAGNNIINSFFMLAAGGMVTVMLAQDMAIPLIYLSVAVMNALVALYIYRLVPTFVWRFMVWIVTHVLYDFEVRGADHLPEEGRAVFACNHPSFVDFMFVASASPRPPRFVMFHTYFDMPVLGWLFREVRVIPIAPRKEDPEILEAAYDAIAEALEEGEVVCIFPEGSVTRDGTLGVFRPGVERIVARTPAPVVPMALKGMWGSYFSHAHSTPLKRLRSEIELEVGAPLAPEEATTARIAREVAEMGEWEVPEMTRSHASDDA